MKKLNKKRTIIISVLFLSIFILGFFQNTKISYAQPQYSDETLTVDSNFTMLESSEETGEILNANSINITLPSSTWNITDLELNFTSIKLEKEVKTIEDQGNFEFEELDWNKPLGWGIQINITEPTTIFGVDLYGYIDIEESYPPSIDVKVQIRGNGPSNEPNETIYGSQSVNFGQIPNWYIHFFSNPVNLSTGYYYLVINGTDLDSSDRTSYLWRFNENPTYTYLERSKFDTSWNNDGPGKVFWHKLIQRVNRSYTPEEDIEMGVEFSGIVYNVTKGSSPYTGNVSIPLNNYSPGTKDLYLPITNNLSIELLVNYSYRLKQKNLLTSDASVLIREGSMNFWSVIPNIVRTDGNYSVQFDYPASWIWPSVFKDGVNETELKTDPYIKIDTIENKIYLLNDTITPTTSWNITAWSYNMGFSASVPTTTYEASQTIKITVIPPSTSGNLTFILVDIYGDEDHRDSVENPLGDVLFQHTFSANPFVGQWKAYILWNNQTDAGLQVFRLQVGAVGGGGGGGDSDDTTIVTGIDPLLIFMTVLYIAIGSLIGLSSYKMVKRHKRAKTEHREKIFNKYMDLLNLDYIMIIDKKSGLNVYEQILAGKERDVSLVSGFLEAIRNFGIELTGSEDESQAVRLQYQSMNIIMNDFKNFRILNVMKEPPSQDFLDSLRPLSHDIETYYGKSLKDFDGHVAKFRGIKDLLEEHLQTSLIYPLKVVMTKETKLKSAEKSLANKALSIMKKNNVDHFFVSYLMGKAKEFNVKNAEIILKLIEKKVFRPIE